MKRTQRTQMLELVQEILHRLNFFGFPFTIQFWHFANQNPLSFVDTQKKIKRIQFFAWSRRIKLVRGVRVLNFLELLFSFECVTLSSHQQILIKKAKIFLKIFSKIFLKNIFQNFPKKYFLKFSKKIFSKIF